MKSYYFKHFVVIAIGTLLVVIASSAIPSFAHAQTPLVVCGTTGVIGVNQNDATGCQACHLFELIDRVVRFLIFIAASIASILFAYAGFKYFTGGVTAHSEAIGIFKDVFIGLVIALCGFLIVDTILRSLASGQFVGPGWNRIQCSNRSLSSIANGGLGFEQLPNTGGLVVGSSAPAPVPSEISQGAYADSDARAILMAAGIAINKANCAPGQTNCTSLEGIRQDTVSQVVYLKQACNCDVVFTGGTEMGHSAGPNSHTAGLKADVSLSPALNAYITSTFTQIETRASDKAPQYMDRYGNIYAKESDHWDILVNKETGPLTKASS